MPAVLFDTLRLSRTLRDKGHFTPEQAETLAEAFSEATHEDLATKADVAVLRGEIAGVKAELKTDIAEVRAELKSEIAGVKAEIAGVRAELKTDIAGVKAELKTDIAEVRADILKWMVGAIGFQTAAILATIVGLVRIFAK
ncbi:MAG: CCDC90 family protein [Beijerinckiaceae bacterium]|nr:CCDC90 family protein [Beijerinckiaceae bacterium]